MSKVIDLRSDTVTTPTLGMREVVFKAEVGDDVFGEDPTVNRLEELAAEMLGKEAALFVPSGTMANQIAVKTLSQAGDAVVMLPHAHIYCYESGAAPFLSGVSILLRGNEQGIIEAKEIEEILPPEDQHFAPVRVVCLENTYYGRVVPLDKIKALHKFCRKHQIHMHLDGARLFNAVVASGVDAKEYAQYFDTVSFCLSKGLGAPVGSLVCTSKELHKKAHRYRKLFGGAMRQAGILAAAGVYALENHVTRLAEDHHNAQVLSQQIKQIPGVNVTNEPVESNMVFVDFSRTKLSSEELVRGLAKQNIKIFADQKNSTSRLVTHLDLSKADIQTFVTAFGNLVEAKGKSQ